MMYRIIQTTTSANGMVSYSLFKHPISIDMITADTYGIIAADYNSSYSIDDILTDEGQVNVLLKDLCKNSITPKEFFRYVVQYLDNM